MGDWPCIHGSDCLGTGIDCGPDQRRRRSALRPAAELASIRARAWATRRAKYGARGHNGSYTR